MRPLSLMLSDWGEGKGVRACEHMASFPFVLYAYTAFLSVRGECSHVDKEEECLGVSLTTRPGSSVLT